MKGFQGRIEDLEKAHATDGTGPPIIYMLHDGQSEPSQEEKDRAMKDYTAKNGPVAPILTVMMHGSEEAKRLTERLISGERLKLPTDTPAREAVSS